MKRNNLLIVLMLVVVSLFTGCKTLAQKEKEKEEWDIEHYFLEAQKNTSSAKYRASIKLLHEVQQKFPNQDIIAVNYLIGFNYYSINNFKIAETYLNKVFQLYETVEDDYAKQQNRKFFILAGKILDAIDEKRDFDPYHVKEEIEANKKIKPEQ